MLLVTYLLISFLLVTIHGSSMELPPNHMVGKFLLQGLECYKMYSVVSVHCT